MGFLTSKLGIILISLVLLSGTGWLLKNAWQDAATERAAATAANMALTELETRQKLLESVLEAREKEREVQRKKSAELTAKLQQLEIEHADFKAWLDSPLHPLGAQWLRELTSSGDGR